MPTRKRVLINVPVTPSLLAPLESEYEIVCHVEEALTIEAVSEYRDIEGWLTTTFQPVTREILDDLPQLRVVSNVAVGYDNIDVAACTSRGVQICNTPDVLDAAVAELAIGMLLTIGRGIRAGDAFVRTGAWQHGPAPLTSDVHGKTLGILGMGRIGRRVARTALALDMNVRYHNRTRSTDDSGATWVDRDTLFRTSDFIVVLVPLTAKTRASVGTQELDVMKKSAYLINVSRGAVVNEAELIGALRANKIAGAALDVMETEPIGADHPLCQLPNVLLLPHVGSATRETRLAMTELAITNLMDALACRVPTGDVNRALASGHPHSRVTDRN